MAYQIPPLSKVQLQLPSGQPVDIEQAIAQAWDDLGLAAQVQGKRIALGVGSRGLTQIPAIARHIVQAIQRSGGEAFVVPAMGSHGGATAAGQIDVLAGLGVTEASVGCPIRATMETVLIGHTPNGLPAYLDRNAAEADGLMWINRVKPHTDFHDTHESGLLKMLAIGLGKEDGASFMHSRGIYGLRHYMPEVAKYLLQHANVIAGFATVEDGYHQLAHLEGFAPDALVAGELRLLDLARELMPRLPVDDIDVLVVDRLGKDISGTGMDTNVIGRIMIEGEAEPETPRIKALVLLDLTEASHGNATGMGLADFTVRRLVDKTDFAQTSKNVFTSGFLARGKIPLLYETDEAAINAAIAHVCRADPQNASTVRLMRICDTLALEEIWVSPSLLVEIQSGDSFIRAEPPQALAFDQGHLF